MKLETLKRAQTDLFEAAVVADKRFSPSRRDRLYQKYADKLILNPYLNRAVVSFQHNKEEPFYRWFKFKEGFSSKLVRYILEHFESQRKCLRVLDPFAGSGTAITTAIKDGHHATAIELLPVGTTAMRARLIADSVRIEVFKSQYERLLATDLERLPGDHYSFPHLRITEGAFSQETELALSRYLGFVNAIADEDVRFLFWFAALSILEDVSYTSKDGQYLRWDSRSSRKLKSSHTKKKILPFEQAIHEKLRTMLSDLKKRNGGSFTENVEIIEGSCLDELKKLPDNSFDLVITSPPYCNRYDYTRTYALELAFLGYDEDNLKELRQTLLSSTVENRSKREHLQSKYKEQDREATYQQIVRRFQKQEALQEVLRILYEAKEIGKLNNNNIPSMVENYFFEMNIVIHELSRVLSAGGRVYMVNDNVQYLGEEVPVDLILSDFAENTGLRVERIWILPKGKGNSSQQMGRYGRNEIRKCVYVWEKQPAVKA